MSITNAVGAFKTRALDAIPQLRRKNSLKVYCEGLKAKAAQADFALQQLGDLENQSDATRTSTDPSEPTIQQRVEFYCDSFWAFLYSCLDVLSQIANQALKLGLDERQVSFKKVKSHLEATMRGTSQDRAFHSCFRRNAFKNLDRYRNCLLHRRQIYVKTEIHLEQHSAGYQTTTTRDTETVVRVLCDNPLDPTSRTTQRRRIPEYLERTRDRVFQDVETVLNAITPVA